MTIEEAKKIIEMCADAVRKNDGEDAKIYVNKEYVLSILDMVETQPVYPWPDYPYPWNPTMPGTFCTDKFIYKKIMDGTGDDAPGKWIPTPENPRPWEPWYNTTGIPENAPEVHITSNEDLQRFKETASESAEPISLYKEKFTTSGPIKNTSDGTHVITTDSKQ